MFVFVLVLEKWGWSGGVIWLQKCGQIFRSYRILCPDLSAVVQDDEGGRDYRTEPGVSTPGHIDIGPRPKGAAEIR